MTDITATWSPQSHKIYLFLSVHCMTMYPASSSPPPLKTDNRRGDRTDLRLTVCQKSSHNRVFASATTHATPLLAIWKLPETARISLGQPSQKCLLLQFKFPKFPVFVSFIAGVHQQVLRFPPYHAPMSRYRADMACLFVVGK